MAKRAALIVASLLAVAAFAAAGITTALILVGNDIFGPSAHALNQAQVRQELAEQRSTSSSSPSSTRPASPGRHHGTPSVSPATAEPTAKSFSSGTVYATCSAEQVQLTGWSPVPGYEIQSVSPGPATSASVRFSSGGSGQLVTVQCAGGQPSFAATENAAGDDNHGGGGAPGGGSGRGGGGGGDG